MILAGGERLDYSNLHPRGTDLAGEDLAPIFGGTKTWEEMGDVRAGDEMRNLQRTLVCSYYLLASCLYDYHTIKKE